MRGRAAVRRGWDPGTTATLNSNVRRRLLAEGGPSPRGFWERDRRGTSQGEGPAGPSETRRGSGSAQESAGVRESAAGHDEPEPLRVVSDLGRAPTREGCGPVRGETLAGGNEEERKERIGRRRHARSPPGARLRWKQLCRFLRSPQPGPRDEPRRTGVSFGGVRRGGHAQTAQLKLKLPFVVPIHRYDSPSSSSPRGASPAKSSSSSRATSRIRPSESKSGS